MDIDQRTQAMRFGNEEDFAKLGEIVDIYEKMSLEGKKITYKLIKLPQDIFSTDAYFAFYNCPSTDKKYLSGIDPAIGSKKSIVKAMAWKHQIEVDEWKRLIPLKNES